MNYCRANKSSSLQCSRQRRGGHILICTGICFAVARRPFPPVIYPCTQNFALAVMTSFCLERRRQEIRGFHAPSRRFRPSAEPWSGRDFDVWPSVVAILRFPAPRGRGRVHFFARPGELTSVVVAGGGGVGISAVRGSGGGGISVVVCDDRGVVVAVLLLLFLLVEGVGGVVVVDVVGGGSVIAGSGGGISFLLVVLLAVVIVALVVAAVLAAAVIVSTVASFVVVMSCCCSSPSLHSRLFYPKIDTQCTLPAVLHVTNFTCLTPRP